MRHLPAVEANGEASVEKFDRVCRKLELKPGDRLLEIGGGWGGFAIHAAAKFGCRVTTTTISSEQHRAILDRVKNEGLSDLITVLQADYRDLSGEFDKLASIEMIEAVGHENLDAYFRICGELLAPDGSMLLQAIVMPERRYASYLRSVDFIRSHVFPGGCLPSLAAILESVGRTTDLRLALGVVDFAPLRAETPAGGRRFIETRRLARAGYSTGVDPPVGLLPVLLRGRFPGERQVGLMQIQFNKPNCRDGLWEDAR